MELKRSARGAGFAPLTTGGAAGLSSFLSAWAIMLLANGPLKASASIIQPVFLKFIFGI